MDGGNDLMGFDDSLDGLEHNVVYGSSSFSNVRDVLGFYVLNTRCYMCCQLCFVTSMFLVGLCVGSSQDFVLLLIAAARAQHHSNWQL